jgi:hypothetical protein
MLFVLRVCDLLEEIWVAVGAAAILGRARSLALYTLRIANAFFDAQRLLDVDGMLPIVSKIIIVAEASVSLLHNLAESNIARIVFRLAAPAKLLAVNHEGIHVFVFPTHASLDNVVEFVQRAIVRLHSSPDRRCDVSKRDFHLVDRQGKI